MKLRGLILAGALVLPCAAWADDASKLTVTIYNAQLALVQDSRNLDMSQGRQVLEFKDVSAQIEPQTSNSKSPLPWHFTVRVGLRFLGAAWSR